MLLSFLGEETAPPSGAVPKGPCFIVDPIDGTTNFVHAHPYISISLCFAIDRVNTPFLLPPHRLRLLLLASVPFYSTLFTDSVYFTPLLKIDRLLQHFPQSHPLCSTKKTHRFPKSASSTTHSPSISTTPSNPKAPISPPPLFQPLTLPSPPAPPQRLLLPPLQTNPIPPP